MASNSPKNRVPEPLAKWALRGHRAGLLAVYYLIKTHDNRCKPNFRGIAKILDVHLKTVMNRVNWLVENGWIRPLKAYPGEYACLSTENLCLKVTGEDAGIVWFESLDRSMLKVILLLSLIDRWNAYHRTLERQYGVQSSIHAGCIASSVIADKTGLSPEWALKWERKLATLGLLEVLRRNLPWVLTWEELDTERSSAEGCVVVRKVRKSWNNNTYERCANKLTPSLSYPMYVKKTA